MCSSYNIELPPLSLRWQVAKATAPKAVVFCYPMATTNPHPKKTYVYIDGFNLYYGILRRKYPGFKWLNLEAWLGKLLDPKIYDVQAIKFCTARVQATPDDPQKPQRQDVYFRALRTLSKVSIVEGSYIKKDVTLRITDEVSVRGKVFEEKGTDVNLGVHMIHDGHKGLYETAVIVSNDSDLKEAVRIVSQELGLEVGVLNPCSRNRASAELTRYSTFRYQARDGQITSSQLPGVITDVKGHKITRPQGW